MGEGEKVYFNYQVLIRLYLNYLLNCMLLINFPPPPIADLSAKNVSLLEGSPYNILTEGLYLRICNC